jgi:hypothetical protein
MIEECFHALKEINVSVGFLPVTGKEMQKQEYSYGWLTCMQQQV